MDKDFYNVKDLMELTGLKKTTCYELMSKLQDLFKKENPNCVVFGKIILKDFYNQKMLGIRKDIDEFEKWLQKKRIMYEFERSHNSSNCECKSMTYLIIISNIE